MHCAINGKTETKQVPTYFFRACVRNRLLVFLNLAQAKSDLRVNYLSRLLFATVGLWWHVTPFYSRAILFKALLFIDVLSVLYSTRWCCDSSAITEYFQWWIVSHQFSLYWRREAISSMQWGRCTPPPILARNSRVHTHTRFLPKISGKVQRPHCILLRYRWRSNLIKKNQPHFVKKTLFLFLYF